MDDITTGFRLRYVRTKKGDTQQTLAAAINISQHLICDWELEKRAIPVWAVKAICKRYKISSDWLLCLEGAKR